MAWMIIKSAGDEHNFIATHVPGDTGHTHEFAQDMARRVTAAMLAAQERDAAMVRAETAENLLKWRTSQLRLSNRAKNEWRSQARQSDVRAEATEAELESARIEIDALRAINALNARTADKLMRENAALLTEREHIRVALGGYTDKVGFQ